jgi:hypothetical protein
MITTSRASSVEQVDRVKYVTYILSVERRRERFSRLERVFDSLRHFCDICSLDVCCSYGLVYPSIVNDRAVCGRSASSRNVSGKTRPTRARVIKR